MIKVFIVEDRKEHLYYLKAIVESSKEMKFLGGAGSGAKAIKAIKELLPQVVLMDIGLADASGIDCIRILKPLCPGVKFMICTIHEEDNNIFEALKAGAHGYILKSSKAHQIIDAIVEMNKGEMPLSSRIAGKILHHLPKLNEEQKASADYHITPKEAEILNCLAKGKSYLEISTFLFISISTLKWHVYNIYRKLQADNRTEALNKYFGAKSNSGIK